MNLKFVLILILAGIVIIFITQNVAVVEVRFLFWNMSMSRALLIFFLLIIGVALGWFLHSYVVYRRSQGESVGDI
ncbi:MAG TPA: LapA family protein [Syntrophales bacterium]|nr:LapA family protein [Syntrophales bacterium]